MHIFDQFFAAFIGVLLATLPAPSAEVTTNTQISGSSTASTTIAASSGLRDALLRLQERFARHDKSSDDSRSSSSSDESHDANDDKGGQRVRSDDDSSKSREDSSSSSLGSRSSDDSDDDDSRSGKDREDEDEDERGDDSRHSSKEPAPTPTATAPVSSQTNTQTQTPAAATFTSAQVAAHATAASCYTIINGSVYDLTKWIGQHPGGSSAIKGTCGIDASVAFSGQHGGQARPASELTGFKIGTLIK